MTTSEQAALLDQHWHRPDLASDDSGECCCGDEWPCDVHRMAELKDAEIAESKREVVFAHLLTLEKDWDSYGAKPINPLAIDKMRELLNTEWIVPTNDGGVYVSWGQEEAGFTVTGDLEVEWSEAELKDAEIAQAASEAVERIVEACGAVIVKTFDEWFDEATEQGTPITFLGDCLTQVVLLRSRDWSKGEG